MNPLKGMLLLSIFVLVLLGCKKEDEVQVDPYVANIAPCTVSEEHYVIDEIIYGPSAKFPNATMRITFENSTLEYAFNKVPETGMYHMVPDLVGSYTFENQIAMVQDSGSFLVYSYVTDYPEVHIDNYNNQLIISYCDLSNSGFYNFDASINAYVGNPSGNRRVRMSY